MLGRRGAEQLADFNRDYVSLSLICRYIRDKVWKWKKIHLLAAGCSPREAAWFAATPSVVGGGYLEPNPKRAACACAWACAWAAAPPAVASLGQ